MVYMEIAQTQRQSAAVSIKVKVQPPIYLHFQLRHYFGYPYTPIQHGQTVLISGVWTPFDG